MNAIGGVKFQKNWSYIEFCPLLYVRVYSVALTWWNNAYCIDQFWKRTNCWQYSSELTVSLGCSCSLWKIRFQSHHTHSIAWFALNTGFVMDGLKPLNMIFRLIFLYRISFLSLVFNLFRNRSFSEAFRSIKIVKLCSTQASSFFEMIPNDDISGVWYFGFLFS